MPFWDDWHLTSELLVKWHAGSVTFTDLVAPLNESRLLFPRLLFLALGLAGGGRMPPQLGVTFLLAAFSSWGLVVLGARTVPLERRFLLGLAFLSSLLVFTPIQAEGWLWGVQAVAFVPPACTVGILILATSAGSVRLRLAGAMLLATIATWSFANGLLLWVIGAPVLLLLFDRRALALWLAGFAANLVLYFDGFPRRPILLEGLTHPGRTLEYLGAFLGSPLGLGRLWLCEVIGFALLVAYVLCFVWFLRRPREGDLRGRLLVWLCLGGYAIGSAFLSALGRSALGIEQALSHRYVTHSLYLPVALAFLGAMIFVDRADRGAEARWRILDRLAAASILVVFVVLHGLSFASGAKGLVWVGRMLRYGKSCLLFVESAPDQACLSSWVLPHPALVRDLAVELDRIGYLRPRLVRTRRLQDLQGSGAREDAGVFEYLGEVDGRPVATGWAMLPGKGRVADAVILAIRDPAGDWAPLVFQPVLVPRPEVAADRGPEYLESGWVHYFAADVLPPPPARLSAWAWDAERAEAWILEKTHELSGEEGVSGDSPGG